MATDTKAASGPRLDGKIKWFDQEKGWGFITPAERIPGHDQSDIFVHNRAVPKDEVTHLADGIDVTFIVGEHRGRKTAVQVLVARAQPAVAA